ncbi:MAG: Glu/Leu/Phe/Val dehydrogenase dimerization domain-containing protein [Gammaproteobacteria bacterium]
MSVFDSPDYDGHEQVVFHADPQSGLEAIIAVHSTVLGPSLGGVRMWPYASEADAVTDVLRLSRGMTYKSALVGLPLGGGKAVIVGDPRKDKSKALMSAMGRFVDRLCGRYIAAEDSGTSVEDLKQMARETEHVAGILDKRTPDGALANGDPSPSTARGVYAGIRAAVRYRFGREDLQGVRIAIQGVGSVGLRLAHRLTAAGAELFVADVYGPSLQRAVEETGATPIPVEDIHTLDVDVFAPCGLGGAINDRTLPEIRARIVAGAANNQLERPRHGGELARRGITYAPDYVMNAGGIIDIANERTGYDAAAVAEQVDAIGTTLLDVFERAQCENRPTHEVADDMARARIEQAVAPQIHPRHRAAG